MCKDITDDSLRDFIDEYQFDIFGFPEVGINWRNTPQHLHLHERTRGYWETGRSRTVCGNNTHQQGTHRKQWGGTAQISRDAAALREIGRGRDPSGLGRWVWQLYRGKQNRRLRVVTAYRPCDKRGGPGLYTTYRQHRDLFNKKGEGHKEPRRQILMDLAKEVAQWHTDGEQVIVYMDCNEDIRAQTIKQWAELCGLREVITEAHGESEAPSTCKKHKTTKKGKTKPIDGVFASWAIEPIASGYTEFSGGIQGGSYEKATGKTRNRTDHRCLWLDLRLTDVFGHSMPPLPTVAGRRMKCNDPRVVERFNRFYDEFLDKHDLYRRTFQLERLATYPLSEELQHEAERIDKLKMEGIRYADRRCRRLCMGGVPFSPEYKFWVNRLKLWQALAAEKRGTQIGSKVLQRLIKAAQCPTKLRDLRKLPLEEITACQQRAMQDYKVFKRESGMKRRTFLEDLAEARADKKLGLELREQQPHEDDQEALDENSDDYLTTNSMKEHPARAKRRKATSAELKNLILQEKSRTMHRRVKRVLGKNQMAALTMVEAPTGPNGEWEEVTDKNGIEQACIDENRRRFMQCTNTPFFTSSLYQEVGPLGIGPAAEHILAGTYQPPEDIDEHTKIFLTGLKARVPRNAWQPRINTLDYQDGWQRIKENTAAGHSGLTFSHCKGGARHDRIADFEAAFASIPLKSGYAYKRWKTGIDVEIPKKANSFRTDKLRTIVLLEADFNFGNKVISRRVAQTAEMYGSLAPEQYGSRKGHRATECALNKRLTLDMLRVLRWPGALCSNDLKSCYDRIAHAVASLCLQGQGVSKSEVVCMLGTIADMEHHIKTAYGISDKTFKSDIWAVPLQGVYQGNGAGPIIWAVVSTPLLSTLREAGYGTFFKCSLDGEAIRLVGYAYVDDTDLVETAKNNNDTAQDILARMQKCVDLWEGMIKATGGALVIEKSCWWLIDFEWQEDGSWKYKQSPGELSAKDASGAIKQFKRLTAQQAFETLGIYLSPDGNDEAAVEELKKKAKRWADKIRTCFLRSDEAATALFTTIYKTLEYPLAALCLTEEECDDIMRPVLEVALPKMGLNRHFSRAVLYGPIALAGLEFRNLYDTSIIERTKMYLRHIDRPTLTGQLLRALVQQHKLELGLEGPLFSHDYQTVSHLLTTTWIQSLWKACSEEAIMIPDHTECIKPQRVNDRTLADAFTEAGCNVACINRLNKCAKFLRVCTLSDITTGSGFCLRRDILEGKNHAPYTNQYQWPNQGQLPPRYWQEWRTTLAKLCVDSRTYRLREPLREWLTPTPTTWPCVIEQESEKVFFQEDGQWYQVERHDLTRARFITTTAPQGCLHRGIGYKDENQWVFTGYGKCQDNPNKRRPSATTGPRTSVPSLTTSKWEVNKIHNASPCILAKIADGIQQGTAVAITDGSYKDQHGTASFEIRPTLHRRGLQGSNVTPGEDELQCAFRSEVGGIAGILYALEVICQEHQITQGHITIACDCQSAGQQVLWDGQEVDPNHRHYDLLRYTSSLKTRLPIATTYQYVEAHQRERYPKRILDQWAILNDRADLRAKEEWHATSRQDRWMQPLSTDSICIKIAGNHIPGSIDKAIRTHTRHRRLRQYWDNKHPHHNDTIAYDAKAIQRAGSHTTKAKRQWVSKFTTGQIGTGRQMKRCQFWSHDKCPCCQSPNENVTHVLQCPSEAAKAGRSKASEQLNATLHRWHTDPDIHTAIAKSIEDWTHGRPPSLAHPNPAIKAALCTQQQIGWEAMLKGRIAPEWSAAQRDFLKASRYRRRYQVDWSTKLVMAMWEYSSSLWRHRNKILHEDSDQSGGPTIDEDFLNQCIRNEWHVGPRRLRVIDRALFQGTSLAKLLDQTLPYRQQWLRSAALARVASLESKTSNDDNASEGADPSHSTSVADPPRARPLQGTVLL